MTTKQAATALGLSVRQIHALIAAGKLGHERLGLRHGKIVIHQSDLDAYRLTCRRPPVSAPHQPPARRLVIPDIVGMRLASRRAAPRRGGDPSAS
jgi:excisionase family DNA binding protein